MTARESVAKAMSEAMLQAAVMSCATLNRWRAVHFRPALTQTGKWVTAMQGDAGFVDLVLARDGVVLHVELKAEKGTLGAGQPEWGEAIGLTYRLWRPSDWLNGTIEGELK